MEIMIYSENFFSILMPLYNTENFLSDAINSVLHQTYNNWELLIVDDGSSDSSLLIASNFARKDSRIHIICKPHEGSAAIARNLALKYANGNYVVLLDSDDWVSNDFLEKYNTQINKENLDIILPHTIRKKNNKILNEWIAYKNNYNSIIDGELAFKLSLKWEICGCGCFLKSLFEKYSLSNSRNLNSDELLTRKLFYNANKIGFSEGIYYYRVTENSTTNKKNNYRYYELLDTSMELYNYVINKKMKSDIVNEVLSDFPSFLIFMARKFQLEKKYYSREIREKIECKLMNLYYFIINKKIYFSNRYLINLIYRFTFGKYSLFKFYIFLIGIIKK